MEPKLDAKLIPRDVSTQWNSTFDMLDVAVQYRKGVDAMTGVLSNGLHDYELSKKEWQIAAQLRDILKVCASIGMLSPHSIHSHCSLVILIYCIHMSLSPCSQPL